MASSAHAAIVGYLGADPDVRYTTDGTCILSASVATNDTIKGEEVSSWFRVTVFGKYAEALAAINDIAKGAQVAVHGRLRVTLWDDKEGYERTSVEVVADSFILTSAATNPRADAKTSGKRRPAQARTQNAPAATAPADQVPF